VVDALIQKPIAKGIRVFLNGENLTNRQDIAAQTGPVKTLGVPLLVLGGICVEHELTLQGDWSSGLRRVGIRARRRWLIRVCSI